MKNKRIANKTQMTDRQYFFRAFRYIRPYVVLYAVGVFLYCIQLFMFPFVNGIALGRIMGGILTYDFSMVLNALWFTIIVILGFMLAVAIGIYAYIMTITYATRDLTLHVFRAFMKSSVESEKHSGEGIAAINTDVDMTSNIFSNAITPFLMNVIAIVFSGITVFVIDWRLGIGAVAVGAITFFIQSCFATPLAKLGKEQLETNADAVKSISNIFAGALTIRAFGRQQQALVAFDKENGKLKKIAFKQAFIGMWQNLFTTVQGWLTIVLVFVLGGWLVVNGSLEFHQLLVILPIAGAIGHSMSDIGGNYARLQTPIVAARRIFDIIDSASGLDIPKRKSAANWNGCYEINLHNVKFAYKNASDNALKNVSLSIPENQMVAFVGESGSGKSTLLRVIMGMYERDDMDIKIGDLPFSTQNLIEWRNHFSYVDQSCKLFDMTIAENIAMGLQGTATQDEIENAAKRAFADDFISTLSDGYNTDCGEKGASLSGGQKQRIAIARALCRKAQVLVFDEATSALDGDSERHIMQTIENLRQDHTVLITTHNLNNVKTADKIVVMDKGSIAEIGTHTELITKDGIYKRLLEEQNAV